jgi:DNA-binding NarL/FixJ family response regulator
MSATEGGAAHVLRVLIVDADHRVRQSLADLLRIAGASIVGNAGDVRRALELVSAERPDAVRIDPRLPDVEAGAALVRGIRLGWPSTRVVVMGWSDALELPALAANASGFVAKGAPAADFLAAVLAACERRPSASETVTDATPA